MKLQQNYCVDNFVKLTEISNIFDETTMIKTTL